MAGPCFIRRRQQARLIAHKAPHHYHGPCPCRWLRRRKTMSRDLGGLRRAGQLQAFLLIAGFWVAGHRGTPSTLRHPKQKGVHDD